MSDNDGHREGDERGRRWVVDDDHDALAALRAGDDGAWGVLWARHRPWLVRYVAGLLRNEADAEDVASEALVRTLGRFTVLEPPRTLRGYLRTVARHLAVDLVRLRDRDLELGERLAVGWSERPDPIERAEERRAVVRALGQMPDRQRYTLIRMLVDGLSITEVADELDLTPNAASQLAFRARRRFRDLFRGLTRVVLATQRPARGTAT